MPSLFISYRRADSPDTVKLIHERLKQRLPRWEIFYDHQSIPLGEEFPELLRAKVSSATAVLVIVGPRWLEVLKGRQNEAVDHVRAEVALALAGSASVVPVLVGRAPMPAEADLAGFADLQGLLKRNGRPVRPDPDFDSDLDGIVAHLEQLSAGESAGATLAGKYTLTAEIGEGGMGVVFAAEQKQPIKRMVAVKLIKPGMDSRDVLARFDAERQALAVMDHPNIARVLDAGLGPSGRPFFVMEYVKGVPITQYCDDKTLTPRERLNLFIPVCSAVQHAHQKGIIHRDLKPTNILVEVIDGNPVPKVIDFGLAKALGQKLTDKTLYTALDTRVGTLEYSSPEQAAGRSFDVDTRSDIYSLGVLLYELLTGAPPFTHEELLKVGEEEMRRVIREVEPTTPSKKLSSSGELPAIAAKRHLEPGKLPRLVRGDLDWIVMKCLEKERARRYETANQLGEELRRYLHDEPVQAGPPSVTYRAKKFLRRNKGPVVAAALVLFALIAGVIGTSVGLIQAEQAREAEVKQRQQAESATLKALAAADRERKQKGLAEKRLEEIKEFANAVDEKALERMNKILGPKHPATAFVIEKLAYAVFNSPKSVPLFEETLERKKAELGPDHLETIIITHDLAWAYHDAAWRCSHRKLWARTLALYEEALQRMKAKLEVDDPRIVIGMNNLALAYRGSGDPTKAVPLFEEVLTKRRAKLGRSAPETLKTMEELAIAYLGAKMPNKAVALIKEGKDAWPYPEPPFNNVRLASALLKAEQHLMAESLLRDFLVAPDLTTWDDVRAKALLGISLLGQNKHDEAKEVHSELAKLKIEKLLADRIYDPRDNASARENPNFVRKTHDILDSMEVAECLFNLAPDLKRWGDNLFTWKYRKERQEAEDLQRFASAHLDNRPKEAVSLFEEIVATKRKRTHRLDLGFREELRHIAHRLLSHELFADAEPLTRELLEIEVQQQGTQLDAAKKLLGRCLLGQGKYAEALPLLNDWLVGRRQNAAPMNSLDSLDFANDFVSIALELLKHEQHVAAEPMLREALEIHLKILPEDWSTYNTKAMLGGSLLGQRNYKEAEPLLKEGYTGMKAREKTIPPEASGRLTEALERLVQLYEATDNPADAERWRKELAERKMPEKAPKK